MNPVKNIQITQVVSFANIWHGTTQPNTINLLSKETILTNKNSQLLIFEGYALHCQATLFPGAVHKADVCNGGVSTKEDSIEIVKDDCTSPIRLTSKNKK